jgi:hypothetical protein
MGVKQKTPTPFVGAGSVRTVTPNLSGVGTAIAQGANDLLQQRFADRKALAIENGNIAGSNFITYDENGNLENLKPLPQGNTYYEQALRQSAKITYLKGLQIDVENFSNKYLIENPYEPNVINEKLDILKQNYLDDIDPSLQADAELIINDKIKSTINQAYSNQVIQKREQTIDDSNIFINNLSNTILKDAEENNAPLKEEYINQIKESMYNKRDAGENISDKTIEEAIKALRNAHNISKNLYGFNKIMFAFDPDDEAKNYQTLEKLNNYVSDFEKTLETDSLKELWRSQTTTRYNNYIDELEKIKKRKDAAQEYKYTENYKNITNNLITAPKESLYIPPENRAIFLENLTNQVGRFRATQIYQQYYQGVNNLKDKIEADNYARPILHKMELGEAGYTNFEDIYRLHPEMFNNIHNGAINTEKAKSYFLNQHLQQIKNEKNWEAGKIGYLLKSDWILKDGSMFHYSLNETEVRENLLNLIKDHTSLGNPFQANAEYNYNTINTMMNGWVLAKKDILENINYGYAAEKYIRNGMSISEDTKVENYLLNKINDNLVEPKILNNDEVLQQMNLMRWHGSVNTTYGQYLKNAEKFRPEDLENTMPFLDRLFNQPDSISEKLQIDLQKSGVNIDYLRNYHDARISDLGITESKEYARNQSDIANTKKWNGNFYNSITGVVWGPNNDTDVVDETSLNQHIENKFKERMYANSGFVDGRLLSYWNDERFRGTANMINAFKDRSGFSWDETLNALPAEFYDNVRKKIRIQYSTSPAKYQQNPDAMSEVITNAIANELGYWHPNIEIAAGGDTDDKPFLTWSKQSLVVDAEIYGGWDKSGYSLNDELISVDIGMKLSLAGVEMPSNIYVEKTGIAIDDEMFGTSWIQVDFTTQFAGKDEDTGENLYAIYYYDEYNRKIQLMQNNEDGSKSPLYYDYTYTNSTIHAAERMAFQEAKDNQGGEDQSTINEIFNYIKAKGLSGPFTKKQMLETNRSKQYLGILIHDEFGKFFNKGNVQKNFKNILNEQMKLDNSRKQRAWLNNTIGSFLRAGSNAISADRLNNIGIDSNFFNQSIIKGQ